MGGHRHQRTPPSERKGRIHTSTITVAVLPVPTGPVRLNPRDVTFQSCRARGAGGQAVQKTESAVQATHTPSGLTCRIETERSQQQNKALAIHVLTARLAERDQAAGRATRNADRRQQCGRGERGDKRRTIRWQDGQVTDHLTDRRVSLDRYLAGWLMD